jgi:hypothetical protein
MFIALGIIGVLWVVGAVIAPDKNGPPNTQVFSSAPAAAPAPSQQTAPPAH